MQQLCALETLETRGPSQVHGSVSRHRRCQVMPHVAATVAVQVWHTLILFDPPPCHTLHPSLVSAVARPATPLLAASATTPQVAPPTGRIPAGVWEQEVSGGGRGGSLVGSGEGGSGGGGVRGEGLR
jgi:hypothetical protein